MTVPAAAPDPASRQGGQAVAQRAIRQVRLLAIALLLLAGVGYRPAGGQWSGGALPVGLIVAGVAALLTATVVAASVAGRRWPHRRVLFAALGTGVDLLAMLAVVCVVGLPPRSLAVVLLMLPLLEAALWFGLAGLAGAWLATAAALAGYVLATGGPGLVTDLTGLMVALPILLLVTIPVAVLAEHLVAEVTRLHQARRVADDRVALLENLSGITAELYPLELSVIATALAAGTHRLGATAAAVLPAGEPFGQAGLAEAGSPVALALLTSLVSSDGPAGHEVDPAAGPSTRVTGDPILLTWSLPLTGGDGYVLRAVLHGQDSDVARRVEAMDLLVAQAQAALANAALVEELTRLKLTYQEQATRDQLTGLVNRRGLLDRARAMPGQLGVLFCDLDGFKAINDTLGHAAGDELLRQVAARLHTAAAGRGVLGRIGGDEFVLVLPEPDPAALAGLAADLERHVALPYTLQAGPAQVGLSVGTATAAPDQHDLDEVLEHADRIMYAVKRARRAIPHQPTSSNPGALRVTTPGPTGVVSR